MERIALKIKKKNLAGGGCRVFVPRGEGNPLVDTKLVFPFFYVE